MNRKEHQRYLQELTDKMNSALEQQKEIQREKVASDSEFDKQKALYLQQIDHLTQKTQQQDEKDKIMLKELKDMKLESHNSLGEAKQKYE